ncbi:acetyl-CoA C-acetyltransferase [Maritalea sp.]|jgi:acetyl-CoA C-acetyltransferase|uniref:acetyl-CoA C-acetyltransferase n=1 Tax=Maritalea sp. TaxID=2003361 RepID=UPI0039E6502E
MSIQDVVLLSAKRTPIGVLAGTLSTHSAAQLGTIAIRAAVEQSGVSADQIDETIMGQVLTAGVGMNPARQAARNAGLPDHSPAMTINQVCGSGLRAVMLGAQQIQTGMASFVVAGGQESMTNAPHVANIRQGKKAGSLEFVDSMMFDALTDAFFGYPMGQTAENVANKYNLSRQEQDEFACLSQANAAAAQGAGFFAKEIVPVEIKTRKSTSMFEADEAVRADSQMDVLGKLRPIFDAEGSVTAANSSGINDGAAALVLANAEQAKSNGLSPLARIVAYAHTGLDPHFMGLGPISASRLAAKRAGWSLDQVDLFEFNEAFAAQSLAVVKELAVDAKKVNIHGGAIALGHPVGMSGARVLGTLVYALEQRGGGRGIASLCIGGGMGIAMAIEV